MSEHTPGPWEAISNGQIISGNGTSRVYLVAKILRIDESVMTDHNQADAHLIAAAPELLAALLYLDRKFGHKFNCEDADIVEAAIANAEMQP